MYTKAIILAALTASVTAQMPAVLPRKTSELPSEETESSPECLSRISSWTGAFPTPAPALESAMESNTARGGYAEDGVSGLCAYASILPKDQTSAYTSFNLEMYSYLSEQSSNLMAIATSCSTDMGAPPDVITSQLSQLLAVYSTFSAGGCKAAATVTDSSSSSASSSKTLVITPGATLTSVTSSASSSTSTSGADSSSSGAAQTSATSAGANASSSPTPSRNAGPRETGMLAAAALAVGLVGAVVAL
ncbi:hypothetical protein GGS26DRAFT_314922 [Hypomontagnella submonticulosa]|nr:hypothetical protein GGS26DRAFT_314922 [Hypomontagnella submonticulosa]